jgi:uncharacterized protein YqjF (DUF2071 family)
VTGMIGRRILVNYRVDPEIASRLVPPPFRPQVVNGAAVAGICLIRLEQLRPEGLPRQLGLTTENAAHRIAVEWETPSGPRAGVFISRRSTNSRLTAALGGRLFPGVHQHARFTVSESASRLQIRCEPSNGTGRVAVTASVADTFPSSKLFADLTAASSFFARGNCGYSPGADPSRYDGMRLRAHSWEVTPLAVTTLESSRYDDRRAFPPGAIEFDCALLMRNIAADWQPLPRFVSAEQVGELRVAEQSR